MPEIMSQLIPNQLGEDWCEWWTKMAANLNIFKISEKDCILSKSHFSFAEVHCVIYKIRY